MTIKLSGIIILISVICSFFTSKTEALTSAAIEGSGKAVAVAFSLISLMCLWCGIMKVAERLGIPSLLSRVCRPVLRHVFPEATESGKGINEVATAFMANLLGLGNGATPLALNAVKALHKEGEARASNDVVAFTVLSCACPCIFPTTVVTLRAAAGSVNPASIVPAVWLCSTLLFITSAILCRIIGGREK